MTKDIRPGLGVDFLLHSDYVNDRMRVHRALVYEVQGPRLILSQSTPAVTSSGSRGEILLTFLAKDAEQPLRLGFPARIAELVRNYPLASGERVAALAVECKGEARVIDIRLYYRLKVTSGSGLRLLYGTDPLNLQDISIGGARFSYRLPLRFAPEMRLLLTLVVRGEHHPVEAQVLRTWTPEIRGQQGVNLATVRFADMSRMEQILGPEIFRIQREQLAGSRLP